MAGEQVSVLVTPQLETRMSLFDSEIATIKSQMADIQNDISSLAAIFSSESMIPQTQDFSFAT